MVYLGFDLGSGCGLPYSLACGQHATIWHMFWLMIWTMTKLWSGLSSGLSSGCGLAHGLPHDLAMCLAYGLPIWHMACLMTCLCVQEGDHSVVSGA